MYEFVLKVFDIGADKLDMALIRLLTRRRSRSDGRAILVARRRAALVAVLGCALLPSVTVGLAVAGGSSSLGDGNTREGTAEAGAGISGMQSAQGHDGYQRTSGRGHAVSGALSPDSPARGSARGSPPTSREGSDSFGSRRVSADAVMASRLGAARPAGRPGTRRGRAIRIRPGRSAGRRAAFRRSVGHPRRGSARPRGRARVRPANGRRAKISRSKARRRAAAPHSRVGDRMRSGASVQSAGLGQVGTRARAADRPRGGARARAAAADRPVARPRVARRASATASGAGSTPPSGGGADEAAGQLVFLGPLILDGPSARRAIFSAPPLRRVSLGGTYADPAGRAVTVVRGEPGTAGRSGRADNSGDGSGDNSGDGSGFRSGDASERGASNVSEPLFSPFASGPLAPVADAVPPSLQWLVTALGALAALVLGAALLATRRSGSAARRRRALLDDAGLLQSALLPPVPARVGGLGASVAYRPWHGPGAGGDFYDVFPLADGRAGAVLGDVAGHGREVIGRTSGLRHTLRAYLEAGLEPRAALELAGRVLERDGLAPLSTAVLAVHDPRRETLTWASAGHPPPILFGAEADEPLTAVSVPPLGAGVATGLRQTTVPLPPGSTACLFTDGVTEARTREGRLGRARLAELADDLGDRLTARELLDRVSREATAVSDDMALCILRGAEEGDGAVDRRDHGRVEELALPAGEVSTSTMQRFLWACGVEPGEALSTIGSARELARLEHAGVLLRVEADRPSSVEIFSLERATLAPVS